MADSTEGALAEMRAYDLTIITDITSDCECESFACEHTRTVYAVGNHGDWSVGIPGVVESEWLDSPAAVTAWWQENGESVRARIDAEATR